MSENDTIWIEEVSASPYQQIMLADADVLWIPNLQFSLDVM